MACSASPRSPPTWKAGRASPRARAPASPPWFTAALFALCVFFVPVIALVGQDVEAGDAILHPAVAPALVMVGFLMLRLVAGIDWSDPEAAIPCFLIIVGVPLTFSISAGIGFGIIGYAAVMAARGKAREVPKLIWALAVMFVAFFESGWLEVHGEVVCVQWGPHPTERTRSSVCRSTHTGW